MKKRIRTLVGAAVLFLLCSLFPAAACAQESQAGEGSDSRTLLTAQVKGQPDAVEDGKGEVTLSDGTVVTVEGERLPDRLLLVVETVEQADTALYEWIAECMEGLGTKFRVFDIYFVDSYGRRYEVEEKITITISLNGAYRSPAVYYVSSGGRAFRMNSSVANDCISFDTTNNSYYVLAEQKEEETEPATPPDVETELPTEPDVETELPSKPDVETELPTEPDEETETPAISGTNGDNGGTGNGTGRTSGNGAAQGTGAKTGDETKLMLWLSIFGGSAGVLLVRIFEKKKWRGK